MRGLYRFLSATAFTASMLVLSTTDAVPLIKVYAGGACVAVSGGTYARFFGTVANSSSTSDLNVFCPFVHEHAGIDFGNVRVFDRNTTRDVS